MAGKGSASTGRAIDESAAIWQLMAAPALSHAWLTIWIRPRATIRRVVDSNPRRYVLQIAASVGSYFSIFIWFVSKYAPNGRLAHSSPMLSAVFGVVGAAIGIIGLYFAAFFYRWVGRIFGGVADYVEVRAALAWSWVPLIYIAVASVPFDYWLSRKAFADWASKLPQQVQVFRTPQEGAVLRVYLVLYLFFGLAAQFWWYVIRAKCLGEVNRFSAWLGLATDILGFIATVLGLMISLVVAVVGVLALGALIYFVATETAHMLSWL